MTIPASLTRRLLVCWPFVIHAAVVCRTKQRQIAMQLHNACISKLEIPSVPSGVVILKLVRTNIKVAQYAVVRMRRKTQPPGILLHLTGAGVATVLHRGITDMNPQLLSPNQIWLRQTLRGTSSACLNGEILIIQRTSGQDST